MYQTFLVEGLVNVCEALAGKLEVEAVFGVEAGFDAIHERLGSDRVLQRIEQVEISEKDLGRISTQRNPHLVVATVRIPSFTVEDLKKGDRLLYLDKVGDPGNAGTLIRTADWFGCAGALASPESVDWYNPKAVAATRGSLFRLPHMTLPAEELKTSFADYTIIVSDLNGQSASDYSWPERGILAIGSESHGPTEELLRVPHDVVTLPRATGSRAESLNAAIAGGILLGTWK